MAEESLQEKTEAPSPRRREKLRTEGQVAYSRELPGALGLLSMVLVFVFAGSFYFQSSIEMLRFSLQNIELGEFNGPLIGSYLANNTQSVIFSVLMLMILVILVAIVAGVAQIGFRFSSKPITPKFLKLNPLNGLKRIFSLNNLVESVKILIKISVIFYLIYSILAQQVLFVANYQNLAAASFLTEFWDMLSELLLKLSLVFLLIAGFDYFWQRFSFERNIKMTKQEYKDDLKQSEGDPLIKARIRRIQQKMSRARMLQEIPTADILITNPTHYAVALKYDAEIMSSPQVVAKGIDYLALRMIEIATSAKIIITRNPVVARGLYSATEIGDYIPEEFYQVIAEILATAYKAKGIRVGANN